MLLERLFFILLLAFLPTQLTRHFFFDFSLVLGSRIDYYSVQIYLTDIFLLLTIFFWFLRKGKYVYLKTVGKVRGNYLFLMLLFVILNLLVSPVKELFFLKFLKLIELSLLAFYIYFEKISFKSSVKYLLIGSLYSSMLTIGQFVKQSSLGGLWWFFGERTFSVQTPGISKAEIFGRLYLRPYATFPHPNVLAGFLALMLALLVFFSKDTKTKKEQLFILVLFILLTISLLLSFSRIAILVGSLGFIRLFFSLKKQKKSFLIVFIILLILFSELIIGRFYSLFLGSEETFMQRHELIVSAINMFLKNPVLGIGLNNFIKFLPETANFSSYKTLLQPVHNTYLLFLAETGFVGFSLFILLLYKTYKIVSKNFPILTTIFYQLLILLFFDHYFYTLQQGQLLFTILISFMIKKDQDYV